MRKRPKWAVEHRFVPINAARKNKIHSGSMGYVQNTGMTFDYHDHRRKQEDIGFKIATFVAGLMHYFSISFFINVLRYSNDRGPATIIVIFAVNVVVFVCLTIYAHYVYEKPGIFTAIWRVLTHEWIPFLMCMVIDIFA